MSTFENLFQAVDNPATSTYFNIENFKEEGFQKICDVFLDKNDNGNKWIYKNINIPLMYGGHNSWVYFIVVDDNIVKCGETEQPLGIKSTKYIGLDRQPITGTKSRFGRLANMPFDTNTKDGGTDFVIRELIKTHLENNCNVNLWARKCEIFEQTVLVAGQEKRIEFTFHKDLEKIYLDLFKRNAGSYPELNKNRS